MFHDVLMTLSFSFADSLKTAVCRQ